MYIFISNEELLRHIKQEFLSNLTAGLTQAALDREEATAMGIVKSKLRHRYDVDLIFETDPRDQQVMNWLCTIMIYNLHRRQNNRGIPDDVSTDYDNTIKWLNDIRDGKEHPDLPLLPDNEDGSNNPGSNDLRSGSKTSMTGDNFFLG